jgi:nucleoid-associated protein YejK
MKTSEKIKSCPEHTEDRPKKETTVIKKKPVKKMPDHVADAILASAGIDADKELQRAMDTVARYEKDWERNRELVRENEVLRSNCDQCRTILEKRVREPTQSRRERGR